MDPIAHTLAGATLAQTGLKRRTRFGAAALVIGANLPDIDAVATLWGSDAALYWRRGITHGVVGLIALPPLLAIALWGLARVLPRALGRPTRGEFDARQQADRKLLLSLPMLIALAYIGTLTHPFLDWLNTYGVRLLHPFSQRWFYGDAVFIVDPWLWLLLASSVALATTRGKWGVMGWSLLALASTALVLVVDIVPPSAKAFWMVGMVLLITLRQHPRHTELTTPMARAASFIAVVYIAAMIAVSQHVKQQALERPPDLSAPAIQAMAGPLAAQPFSRDVIVETDVAYQFYRWDAGPAGFQAAHAAIPKVRWRGAPVPPALQNRILDRAVKNPQVRGLSQWLRFPAFILDAGPTGYHVDIADVRYSRTDRTDLGTARVHVSHAELQD